MNDKSNIPDHELAENDYMLGMKYKDIAVKYGASINTVKSWKKRYGWDRKSVHTKKQKVCTQKHENIEPIKVAVADEVNSVIQNSELTEKERLFCLYFVKMFNATKAYKKAFVTCTEYTARINGCKLLSKPKIKAEIEKLKSERLNQMYIEQSDIFQKYLDIVYADMTDYVTIKDEFISVKDDTEIDGTLITEISQGKNGIKIKLADKMKALEWIANHMNIATEEQKAKIEFLKAQADKLRSEDKVDTSSDEKMDNISKILEQMQGINANDIAD